MKAIETSAAEAKANFKAKVSETQVGELTWVFGNGKTAVIKLSELSEEIIHAAVMHGLKQTVSDSYSGCKDAGECHAFAQVRIDTLVGGEWSSRGKAGEGNTDLAQAASNLTGKPLADCVVILAAYDEKGRKEFAKKPQIAAEVARIKAERLAKAATEAGSLDDLFGVKS